MRRRHLAALLLVPALALTGCGSDGEPDPTPSAQTPTDTPATAPSGAGSTGGSGATPSVPTAIPSKILNDFVTCMRKHGVDVPDDPRNWTPDAQDSKTQKALMACIGRSGGPPGS
ncbi:hypothetical protein [Actinomadura sp. 7K507]|uniref:hypothetical protein n=1 Tax=Actinomadura sp. 7K507 TaxID=2530365 RepID=UPI001042E7B6|nr:hypothetical protein [Actinomadura sp. 7K507]TDC81170.1 hypothetical protein E1285_33310 [Actinomadura sp. 7K507]